MIHYGERSTAVLKPTGKVGDAKIFCSVRYTYHIFDNGNAGPVVKDWLVIQKHTSG